MDLERRDAIAQGLAAATSRRGVLKGVGLSAGGAAVAGLLSLLGRDAADAATRRRRRRKNRRCRGLAEPTSPPQESPNPGAIGVGDYHCPCYLKGCC
jgi:hypothetical protein